MTNYGLSNKLTNTFSTRVNVFHTTTSNVRDRFGIKIQMVILRKCMKDACSTVTPQNIHSKCLSLFSNAV